MVVFTCGHCGESVQKPKVEKHYQTKCRNRNPNLSCMDCFKDFYGNDYEVHTKCITEEQRYSGKGFVAKEKKGEKKQNAWVEMLQEVLDEQKTASGNVRRILETISKHNNTPRKKPKFVNFVKNVCGQKTNPKDIDQAWDMISVKLGELAALNASNRNENKKSDTTNGKVEDSVDDVKENGDTKDDTELNNPVENGKNDEEVKQNGNDDEEKENESHKKLTKKQRKEEKKRKKYEAELKSAEEPVEAEEVVENDVGKKGKKKKNKSESQSEETEVVEEGKGKNKNKKRKRQDTVNSVQDSKETVSEPVPVTKVEVAKAQKKKLKVDEEEDEGICLHDQNVAKAEEVDDKKENFDWHSVIFSVLQKKGNEIPFKRLQKKVLGEYSEFTGQEVDDRIAEKFIKKLKSAPNVRVVKNTVHLLE